MVSYRLILMRINIVLVDYENVKALDLRDLKREDVRVILFLGSNQQKVPTELAVQMQALGDRGEYVQISGNGPNALDFHIAFTIGERSASEVPQFFHIISGDLGFDPLIAYLKRNKIFAARYKAISDIPFVIAAQPKSAAARAAYLMEKFSGPTMPRPRSLTTLKKAITRMFHPQLPEKEISDVMKSLVARGFIQIEGEKLTYPMAGASSSPVQSPTAPEPLKGNSANAS